MNQLSNTSITPGVSVNLIPLSGQRQPFAMHIFLYREGIHEKEYLLFHRVGRPDLGISSFWQGIEGSLTTGESWENAVKREVFEKSRIVIHSLHKSDFIRRYPIKKEWRSLYGVDSKYVEERVFYSQLDNESLPEISNEHNAFGWFNYEKASRLLNVGANRQYFESIKTVAR